MKTVALSRLGYEDLSPTNIVALSLHWAAGNRTLYRGEGRPDNMLFYTVSGTRARSALALARSVSSEILMTVGRMIFTLSIPIRFL